MKFFTLLILFSISYNGFTQNLHYYLGATHFSKGNLKAIGNGGECVWNNPSGLTKRKNTALNIQAFQFNLPDL